MGELEDLVLDLLGSTLSQEELHQKYALNIRGEHFPCILGHYRQSMTVSTVFHFIIQ
jgi:hypothetical protein